MEDMDFSVDDLGGLFVLDEQNESVKLSSLWQKKIAVLVFVRHFG